MRFRREIRSGRLKLPLLIALVGMFFFLRLVPSTLGVNLGSITVAHLASLGSTESLDRDELSITDRFSEEWLTEIALNSNDTPTRSRAIQRLILIHFLSGRTPPERMLELSGDFEAFKGPCERRPRQAEVMGAELVWSMHAGQQVVEEARSRHWVSAICWYRLLQLESDHVPLASARSAYLRALGHYELETSSSGHSNKFQYGMRLLWLAEDTDTVRRQLDDTTNVAESDKYLDGSWFSFLQGWLAENEGEHRQALNAYKESISSNGDFIAGVIAYYRMAKSLGTTEDLIEAKIMLQALKPSRSPWNSMPTYQSLPNTLNNGWKLTGFTLSDDILVNTGIVHAYVFWEGPEGSTPGTENWYPQGNSRWIQEIIADNRIPNPGFEWAYQDPPAPNVPIKGSPSQTGNYDIVLSESRPDLDHVAVITTASPNKTGSVRLSDFSVEPGQIYLTAAWMKQDPGKALPPARLAGQARLWWTGDSHTDGQNISSLLPPQLVGPFPLTIYANGLSDLDGSDWFYVANLISVPPAYNRATVELALNMVNYSGQGSVYYDNLLMVPISFVPE